MSNTHTWMGDAIQFAVEYKSPFWRMKGYFGPVFSHLGITTEIYDHCDLEVKHFVLKGFHTTIHCRWADKAANIVITNKRQNGYPNNQVLLIVLRIAESIELIYHKYSLKVSNDFY